MLLTDLEPQLVRCPPAVLACRSRQPASGEHWARVASSLLRLASCHTSPCLSPHAGHQCKRREATILALQLSKLGQQARQPRTAHAHHAHTLCTPCALRGPCM